MVHARPEQPRRLAPEKKVGAAGVAAAAVLVLVWLARLVGLDLPEHVAEAVIALVMFGAAYLAPPTRRRDLEAAPGPDQGV